MKIKYLILVWKCYIFYILFIYNKWGGFINIKFELNYFKKNQSNIKTLIGLMYTISKDYTIFNTISLNIIEKLYIIY